MRSHLHVVEDDGLEVPHGLRGAVEGREAALLEDRAERLGRRGPGAALLLQAEVCIGEEWVSKAMFLKLGTSGCGAPLSVARMETTMLRCSGLSDCATAKLLPSARVFSPWAASMTAAGASGLVGVFDSERTDIFL